MEKGKWRLTVNLVPRFFLFSNMVAAGKMTLGHSRSRDLNHGDGDGDYIQNGGQEEAVRGSVNKTDKGKVKAK